MPRPNRPASAFQYFNSSPEVISLVVLMYMRFPVSLRNVEALFFERRIDICHETVRFWWNRFGPMFAGKIPESYITKTRDKEAALRFMKKTLKRHGSPAAMVTDGLKFYRAGRSARQ